MSAVSETTANVAAPEQRRASDCFKGYTPFRRHDVLVAKITPCFENGKIVIADIPLEFGFGSTEFHVVRPRPGKLHPRYLLHAIRRPEFRARGERRMTGSAGQRRVPSDFLSTFEIPLPPFSSQERIAEILDRAEALRAKRRAALSQLDTLTQSIFLEMFGEPIANEKCWTLKKVSEAGRVQLGRQRSPKFQSGNHTRPYVRVANVYEDHLELSDVLSMDFDCEDFEAYKLESGDILLNEGQSTELVGRPAMWRNEIADCCFQNTLVRFQPNRKTTDPIFALSVFIRYFRSGQFARISSKTSNVAHLGAGRFAAMPFPLPPLPLQNEFARRAAAVEKLKAAQRQSLQELDNLFASLQSRAFRGEL